MTFPDEEDQQLPMTDQSLRDQLATASPIEHENESMMLDNLQGAENVGFRRGTGSCTCWTGRGPPGREAKFSTVQDCPWDRDMLLFSSSRFWDTN